MAKLFCGYFLYVVLCCGFKCVMFNLYAFYLCVNFYLSQKLDRLIRKLVLPYSKNFSDIFEKLFSSFENILSRLENILSRHEIILSRRENTFLNNGKQFFLYANVSL